MNSIMIRGSKKETTFSKESNFKFIVNRLKYNIKYKKDNESYFMIFTESFFISLMFLVVSIFNFIHD